MRYVLTTHATLRFIERVRPGLEEAAAATELLRLLSVYGQDVPRPEWYEGYDRGVYVQISPGVVVACTEGVQLRRAMTVLANAGTVPRERRRRNKARRRHHAPLRMDRRPDEPWSLDWA